VHKTVDMENNGHVIYTYTNINQKKLQGSYLLFSAIHITSAAATADVSNIHLKDSNYISNFSYQIIPYKHFC